MGLILLYYFYSRLEIGGAPELPYAYVAISTLRIACGLPDITAYQPIPLDYFTLLAIIISMGVLLELIAWLRQRDPTAILVSIVLAAPIILIAIGQPSFILSRYFVVQIALFYLVLARLLCRLAAGGSGRFALSIALLTIWTAGTMSQSINLISLGRAHTLQILQTVRDRSSIPSPTLGGEQDFQNGIRLKYEQIKFPNYRPITYVEDYSHAQIAPEFVLLERLPGMPRPDYKFLSSSLGHPKAGF